MIVFAILPSVVVNFRGPTGVDGPTAEGTASDGRVAPVQIKQGADGKGIDVLDFAKRLREKHHLVIDPGYGKIRGQTFRLSNMGDETEQTVSHLLACLDDVL